MPETVETDTTSKMTNTWLRDKLREKHPGIVLSEGGKPFDKKRLLAIYNGKESWKTRNTKEGSTEKKAKTKGKGQKDDYESWTNDQLRQRLRELSISYSGLNKANMISKLKENSTTKKASRKKKPDEIPMIIPIQLTYPISPRPSKSKSS
jgi:hypothetical protein